MPGLSKSNTARAAAYRSDVSAVKAITGRATTQAVTENQTLFGFALVGGFYLYATVPYVFVAPIIGLGSCTASLNTLISYGGPSECTYDDPPPPEGRTCTSNMTLLDTMGDQGWPSMYSTGRSSRRRSLACPEVASPGLPS